MNQCFRRGLIERFLLRPPFLTFPSPLLAVCCAKTLSSSNEIRSNGDNFPLTSPSPTTHTAVARFLRIVEMVVSGAATPAAKIAGAKYLLERP